MPANLGALVARCRCCGTLFVAAVRDTEKAHIDFDVIAAGMRGFHTGHGDLVPHQCAPEVRGMADVVAVVNGNGDDKEESYVAKFAALAKQAEGGDLLAALNASCTAAAVNWWKSKQPCSYNHSEHLENPEVNCTTDAQHMLARAVAAVLKHTP